MTSQEEDPNLTASAAASEPAGIDEVLEEEGGQSNSTGASEGSAAQMVGRALAMTNDEANQLAAERRPSVLVLAGGVGSGKTSIYAAMYERLGRGPFAGWMFAGSETIPGFEERCHWWREGSGNADPYMRHTGLQDLPWLHLRLQGVEGRLPARDLLLGDFDGEHFDELLSGSVAAIDLPFLRRADHVGIVIDGARIADLTTRAAERQHTEYLLDALLAQEVIASPDALSLVLTKIDKLDDLSATANEAAEECLDFLVRRAQTLAGRTVPLLRLAVRSHTTKFPLGHGLETFLELVGLRPAIHVREPPPPTEVLSAVGRFAS